MWSSVWQTQLALLERRCEGWRLFSTLPLRCAVEGFTENQLLKSPLQYSLNDLPHGLHEVDVPEVLTISFGDGNTPVF